RRRLGRGRPPPRGGCVQGAWARASGSERARRHRHPVDEGLAVKVVLADYGAGNLRSVCSALERAGATPVVCGDPGDALEAPLTVIAGVGNTASAARGLEERGLAEALRERAALGK